VCVGNTVVNNRSFYCLNSSFSHLISSSTKRLRTQFLTYCVPYVTLTYHLKITVRIRISEISYFLSLPYDSMQLSDRLLTLPFSFSPLFFLVTYQILPFSFSPFSVSPFSSPYSQDHHLCNSIDSWWTFACTVGSLSGMEAMSRPVSAEEVLS